MKLVHVSLFQILFPLSIIFGVPRLRKKAITNINKIKSAIIPSRNVATHHSTVFYISNQYQINDIESLEISMPPEKPSTSRIKKYNNVQETEF